MKIMIPLNDPARKFKLNDDLMNQLILLFKSGPYLNGPIRDGFEQVFAEYIGVDSCVGVSSGTSALELAFKSLNLPVGSEILMTANAGGYGSIAAVNSGLTPKYFDVDERGLASIESLKTRFTTKSKALLITHLYGQMADIKIIKNFCDNNNIYLIEDCAQSTGSKLTNQKSGSFGNLSTFSFYPTKNLATMGDAGAVCTSDPILAIRLRELRQYGWNKRYDANISGGSNFRMDEFHAKVLVDQLKELDDKNLIRRGIWNRYSNTLEKFGLNIIGNPSESFVAHLGVIRVKNRGEIMEKFAKLGVQTSAHYPIPDYRQKAFEKYFDMELKVTDALCKEVLTIPLFPEMIENEILQVEESLLDIFSTNENLMSK